MLPCTPARGVLLEPTPMPQLMSPMGCRAFRKHHLAYLDDTLSGDQMAAAQRHILACDPCAAHDTMVRRSLMLAKSMPAIEPSSAFQERLNARLAQCRTERLALQEDPTGRQAPATRGRFDKDLLMPMGGARPLWRSPRTFAALVAGAVLGTMVWRGLTPSSAPLVAMQPVNSTQPVIATQPVAPQVQYVSPALLRAMATGNPVWPATVIIDETPHQFVSVNYSMSLDGR